MRTLGAPPRAAPRADLGVSSRGAPGSGCRAGGRAAAAAVMALMALIACVSATAVAQSNLPVPRYDEKDSQDSDSPPLPAYPKPASLIRFPTSWTTSEVFVDGETLTVHGDGLIRYTLVVKAAGGAENVSYEALRCGTGQLRVYAYGQRDGTWAAARVSQWRGISDSRINRHHFEFWRDVFCDGKALERRSDILLNLKRGGRERPQSIPSD